MKPNIRLVPMSKTGRGKAGMTCGKVLGLLAGILLVAFLGSVGMSIYRQLNAPREEREISRTVSIARAIFQLIEQENLEIESDGQLHLWPARDQVPFPETSTEYFRWLIENNILHKGLVDWIDLGNDEENTDHKTLTAEQNPWSVVVDLTPKTAQPRDPFLISRNLNESALIDWQGDKRMRLENVGRRGTQNTYVTPFDDRLLVVVTMDGGGSVLYRRSFFWRELNPNSRTNRILNP
ncbi:MAG: hypothetical protein JJU29_07935 [Verrucomicrobia bacterium]|nr:hypothetical protein [Verrucomicrobiota bacterium]MCH8511945.1 hypothetical protein [Kiritimatiellia bacterium]